MGTLPCARPWVPQPVCVLLHGRLDFCRASRWCFHPGPVRFQDSFQRAAQPCHLRGQVPPRVAVSTWLLPLASLRGGVLLTSSASFPAPLLPACMAITIRRAQPFGQGKPSHLPLSETLEPVSHTASQGPRDCGPEPPLLQVCGPSTSPPAQVWVPFLGDGFPGKEGPARGPPQASGRAAWQPKCTC